MFKCDVRPIGIETNGYKGEAIEDRICKICDMSEIETNEGFTTLFIFQSIKKSFISQNCIYFNIILGQNI